MRSEVRDSRVFQAHVLGLDEVPCIVLAHLTPAQRRAYVSSWRSTPAGISRCSRSKLASWAKRGLTSASPALTSSSLEAHGGEICVCRKQMAIRCHVEETLPKLSTPGISCGPGDRRIVGAAEDAARVLAGEDPVDPSHPVTVPTEAAYLRQKVRPLSDFGRSGVCSLVDQIFPATPSRCLRPAGL
jgi:hypothetical protein